MRKIFATILLVVFVFYFTGCYTNTHIVGSGAQTNQVIEERQWYILFGLVPLNNVDTNSLSAGAQNYTIVTSQTALDIVIGMFTGIVTVYPRTVKVMK